MQEGSYDFDQEEWEFLRRLIDDASDDQGQVERLRRLVESLYDFGQTRTGDPYLVLKSGANIARPIRGNGGDLRPELSCVYADRYGTIPGQQSLSAALMYAHGRCLRVP